MFDRSHKHTYYSYCNSNWLSVLSSVYERTHRGRTHKSPSPIFSLAWLRLVARRTGKYSRPFCDSYCICFSSTHNTKATLSVLPRFPFHVRLLKPPPPSTIFEIIPPLPFIPIPSPVMKLPQTGRALK